MQSLAPMIRDYTYEIKYKMYTADCMGMLVRAAFHSDDFKLFSDIAPIVAKPDETVDQVKAKILRLCGV